MSEPQHNSPFQYTPTINKTNSSLSLKKNISSVLSSCRICLSSVFEPARLTNCGHSFCEKCLNTYWHVNNKPEYIVCPLCRGQTSNIAFALKEDPSSTDDLRKTFDCIDKANSMNTSSLCLKMMLIPILYWLVNWLRAPMIQLVTYFQTEMAKLD